MKRLFLALSLIFAACAARLESNLRIAVGTSCKYEKVEEIISDNKVLGHVYEVVKTYALYNLDGTKDMERETRGSVGAASHDSICFDDFAIEKGCPKNIMEKVSEMHGGAEVYCIMD